jgi:predicted DsbA family dithiol-disulfide isomerase
MASPVIRIDVVSDVVCPWCYIGKTRLDKAVNQLRDTYDFIITYHPFELNPDLPATGVDQKHYLTKKFGGPDRYQQITQHVTRIAAEEGLAFDFDKQHVSPNTRQAHRLIRLAHAEGVQDKVVKALFSAYFEKGVDLASREALIRVVTEAGLDETRVRTLLSSDEGLHEVIAEEKQMQELGITGVPFYIINQRYGVSGAQPVETLVKVISEAPLN